MLPAGSKPSLTSCKRRWETEGHRCARAGCQHRVGCPARSAAAGAARAAVGRKPDSRRGAPGGMSDGAALVPAYTVAVSRVLRRERRGGGWAEDAVVLSHGDALIADVVVLHAVNAASLAQKRADREWRWALNPMHLWVAARDRLMLSGLRARHYVAVSTAGGRGARALSWRAGRAGDGDRERNRYRPVHASGTGRRRCVNGSVSERVRRCCCSSDMSSNARACRMSSVRSPEPGCETAHLVAVGAGDEARFRGAGGDARSRLGGCISPAAQRDLSAIYREADAFVLPTAYETFSLVCMEAMACGVPVFATAVGGIEDYLRDGVNGFGLERDAGSVAAVVGTGVTRSVAAASVGRGRAGDVARRMDGSPLRTDTGSCCCSGCGGRRWVANRFDFTV